MLASEADPDLPSRLKAVESAMAVFTHTGPVQPPERRLSGSQRRGQDEARTTYVVCGMRGDATLSSVDSGMCVHHAWEITRWWSAHMEARVVVW